MKKIKITITCEIEDDVSKEEVENSIYESEDLAIAGFDDVKVEDAC